MAGQTALLYDDDCGFCRWTLNVFLRWDRHDVLRTVALQDPEADRLLGGMDEQRKMASFHLVTDDGRIRSGGEALTELVRLLPGGRPLAALLGRMPRVTDRAYYWVAGKRSLLGRFLRR